MLIHSREKPYRCTLCDKQFIGISNLNSHMQIDSEKKRYQCSLFNKQLLHSSELKFNMLIHIGGKPYQCTLCDAEFVHERIKKHLCTVCGTNFSTKFILNRHINLKHSKE